ncbi:MAG: SAVED domain-containing protein [Anaerolineales bacterium]|nr:SAVED domain-containing protein [Anaerolineales bacterium]
MAPKKLFIAHSSRNAPEVHALADELRLRGIVPWVDKQGGLMVGDHSEVEARRAIREDCFGLLLYASREVFESEFVRDVELHEARLVKAQRPEFLLFAVPSRMDFGRLRELSQSQYGIDLSTYHSVPVDTGSIPESQGHIAAEVMTRFLSDRLKNDVASIDLQFSTRDLMPDEDNDLLRIDGTALVGRDPCSENNWNRLTKGLRDIKARLAAFSGRPRLRVHGSKHLTAAFILGRVFAQFDVDIRQTPLEYWRIDLAVDKASPFDVQVERNEAGVPILIFEIRSGVKNVRGGVDAFIESYNIVPRLRLRLDPNHKPLDVDNRLCRQMTDQAYDSLESTLSEAGFLPEEIHIFAAVPQTMMVMLGMAFRGIPAVVLHEWTGTAYCRSHRLFAGAL